jgi:hypothetical protein
VAYPARIQTEANVAPEPAPATLRPRQRWLLIGPPVVLLFGRGVRALVELALADTAQDRVLLVIGLALLSMLAAVLLLSGGRWGWLLAVGIIGGALAAELAQWWFGSPDYVAMALLTLCAILVTSPDMRAEHIGRSRR